MPRIDILLNGRYREIVRSREKDGFSKNLKKLVNPTNGPLKHKQVGQKKMRRKIQFWESSRNLYLFLKIQKNGNFEQ